MKHYLVFIFFLLALTSCVKTNEPDPTNDKNINFSLKFDSTQVRLGNAGQPVNVPAGHWAQSPKFRTMAVHFIELCPDSLSALSTSTLNVPNKSVLLYKGVETDLGGSTAIDFDQLNKAMQGMKFFSAAIKNIPVGTYKYIRVSVAYQNYDVRYNINNLPFIGNLTNQTGTVASFLGYNTYIRKTTVNTKDTTINSNKAQGFGLAETRIGITTPIVYNTTRLSGWQSPQGATTVVNPAAATLIGLPLNSCLIQGKFTQPLVITGKETADINTVLSFSTNKSFEWIDTNGNRKLDFDAMTSANSETVVDMGLRGLVASWQ